MAKETKQSPSFSDFTEDNLLQTAVEDEKDEVIDEEVEEQEQEKEEKKETPKKEKVSEKKKEKKEVKEEVKAEVEDEEETEESKSDTEEETETSNAEEFFAEVEKLTGLELDVDYGDTDPLSPQGVALREAAVKEAVLDSFLAEMEEKFPVVFKALRHANNGGDPADLFSQTTSRDYSKVTLGEEDEDLAKEILKEYYKARGVKSEAKITKLIESDEDSESGLVKEAQSALNELKAEQAAKSNELLETQARKAAEDKKRDQVLIAAVDEVIDSKDLSGFKITDKSEAADFRDFVLGNVRKVGDGKYEIATPIETANLSKILQYQYFQFKKGDLGKIIRQKVETESAKKLSLRLKAEQGKYKKQTVGAERTSKLSLKDYEA